MKDSKFSIVTPSLNQGHYLEIAIKSVLEQNHSSFEHIIMDGGSTDKTLSILKSYPHLKWISEPDRGQSDALNKGFKFCSGDIIGWLNADDRYLDSCFSIIAEYFDRFDDIDIVYGDYRWIDENGRLIKIRKEIDYDLFILKYLHVLYIPTTATFFRRRILDDQNFINIQYHYAMDYEYFLRLAQKGYKIAHIKHVLADYRWHSKSKSSAEPKKQSREQEKALAELDPVLFKLKSKKLRYVVRHSLLLIARIKRTICKILQRCYW